MNADIKAEALRVVEAGQAQGIILRLLGGLAVLLHSPSAQMPPLARSYADIDLATPPQRGRAVETLLAAIGYVPDQQFNLLNGDRRLLFRDPAHNRQLDVFVGAFEMCHKLPLSERLALEPLTLPLAELLLTKLQIVQLNEKDLRDIYALLIDHPLGEGDQQTISMPRIGQLCGEDWGLWRTVTGSLDKAGEFSTQLDLEPAARRTLTERIEALKRGLEAAPKSLKWRMRAKVGDRVRWYELPEEVGRG